MYKLVITDLDDTLYSWTDFFISAFYEMLKEISFITEIKESVLIKEYREQHQKVGSVEHPFTTLCLPSIIQFYEGQNEEDIRTSLNPAFHRFNSVRKCKLKLFDGAAESIQKAFAAGITIIGYTESAEENGFYRLKKLGIDSFFTKVYVSESQYNSSPFFPSAEKIKTVQGKKPNPEILENICKIQNMDVSSAIYIGDSLTKDIYMAKQAGITCIQVKCQHVDPKEYQKLVAISHWTKEDFLREEYLKKKCQTESIKPDYIVTNFSEIDNIIGV